jgi:hypothetical protein
MIVGPSRRLQAPDCQRRRPVWRGVGGLVAAVGLLGLPPACLGEEGVGVTPQPDRAMVVRIPGARIDGDPDGVQAPPRPPVKEQDERKGWQPGARSPRRYLAAPQRDGPPSRAVPPTGVRGPAALDSVPTPTGPAVEPRLDGQSRPPERPGNERLTEEPRPLGQEVREEKPPADRIPEPALREDAPSENGPSAQAQPRLRLSVDEPPVWRVPIGDQPAGDEGPSAHRTAEPDASPGAPETRAPVGDDDAAPIRLRVGPAGVGELPRPQVFADEPAPQDPPAQELPVAEPPGQDPPEDNAAAGQPSRSIAERIEISQDVGTPEEPEGEDAQATDGSPPGEAVLQDDATVAGPFSVTAADPRPTADNRGPVELRLAPSRPAAAPAVETIKVSVGPSAKVAVGSGQLPVGSRKSAVAESDNRQLTTDNRQPIHLSLKFPASKSATPPKTLRVRKTGPVGVATPKSTASAAAPGRPGMEPVIVAKLGPGAGSAKGTSPASGGAQPKTADKAAASSPRPIRLTIKGSKVISQSGGEAAPEEPPPASSGPEKDSKGSGSSAKEKSTSAGSAFPDHAGRAARAAARLNQWSLFGAKPAPPTPPEARAPRLLEASRPSTASLR